MKILDKLKKSDGSIIFASNLFIAILNFSTTIFLIRILNQKEFGDYVIISSFILLLQVLLGLRTGEALLKFVEKEIKQNNKKTIIKELLIIDFFINCILYLVITLFGYFYSINQSIDFSYFLVFGIIVFVNIGLSIFEYLYIIQNKIVKMHKIKLIATAFIFLITLSSAYFWQLKGAIIGTLLGLFFKNFILFYNIKGEIIDENLFFNKIKIIGLKKYLQFFKLTYISTSFKAGSQGLDIFLLSLVFTNEKIALYEVGKKFSQIPGLILGSIWTAKSKIIIEHAQNGEDKNLFVMIKRIYRVFMPLGLILSFIFLWTGKDFIVAIFGDEYVGSFPIAMVFFVFFWFGNLFGGYSRLYLLAINKAKILTILNGLLFFNVLILGYYTKHNIMHMALTICITILFNALYLNFYIFKRINSMNNFNES